MLIKEYCAENFTNLPRLREADIHRIELCDNLAVGGTTASYGTLKQSAEFLAETDIALSAMIRPRGGDYVYNSVELKIMEGDVLCAVEAGVTSLVFGALTSEDKVDSEVLETLMVASQGLPVTFHMAFDQVVDQEEALEVLVDLGFDKILMHGGPLSLPLNVEKIANLVDYAADRIDIMIGGGVRADNYEELARATRTKFVHGTQIVSL